MRRLSILINAPTFRNTDGMVDRQAGFSDSWYQAGGDSTVLSATDNAVIAKRAALLPATSTIVAARIGDVDQYGIATGKTKVYRLGIAGGQALECDDPRVCLVYDLDANELPNEMSLFIQNVPDIRVVKGTYNPVPAWQTAVTEYIGTLYQGNYGFWGYNMNNPKFGVDKILYNATTGLATVQFLQDTNFVQFQYIRFLRTSEFSTYKPRSNGYRIEQVINTAKVTISNWNAGNSVGGTAVGWGKVHCLPFCTAYAFANPSAGTRKVGRPFFQYRGRGSKGRLKDKNAAPVE